MKPVDQGRMPAFRRGEVACLMAAMICLFAFGVSAAEPGGLESVTEKELLAHVRNLASPAFQGRSSGTRGCDGAAKYLIRQLRSSGVAESGGGVKNYLQKFMITLGLELGKGCALALFSRQPTKIYEVEKDYMPFSFSPRAVAKRKIVFAGYGITAPEYEWDDYRGIDARNKIVLCFRKEPRENDDKSPFKGKQSTEHAYFVTKVLNAQEHGAKGILIVDPPLNTAPGKERLTPLRGPDDERVKIPAAHVKMEVAEDIIEGTGETLAGLQHKIDEKLEAHSFEIKGKYLGINTDVQRQAVPTFNVVGYIEGADPVLKEEIVIVGAHYDHIGLGTYGSRLGSKGRGQVHPGADDNASGTAGVLEIAQAFALQEAKPCRSLLFIGFSGEERGLLGSTHYVKNPLYPLDRTAAMLNLDMISRGPEGAAGVTFTGTWNRWEEVLEKANERLGLRLHLGSSGSGASDHAPFCRAKIPCLFFAAGLHPDYHTPGDTWQKVNAKTMVGITKLAYLTAEAVADCPEKPVFSEPRSEASKLPYLGIVPGKEVKDMGVTLQDVSKGSPAEKGGLKKGDILAEFDGRQIRTFQDLRDALALKKPDDEVNIVIYRGGEEVECSVKLAKKG